MIDAAQAILLLVLLVLTALLLILGIQVFFILRELRQTIAKTNKVLDDAGMITESVSGPINTFSSLASGVKTGALIAGLLKKRKRREDDDE